MSWIANSGRLGSFDRPSEGGSSRGVDRTKEFTFPMHPSFCFEARQPTTGSGWPPTWHRPLGSRPHSGGGIGSAGSLAGPGGFGTATAGVAETGTALDPATGANSFGGSRRAGITGMGRAGGATNLGGLGGSGGAGASRLGSATKGEGDGAAIWGV